MRNPLRIAIDYDGTIADTNEVKASWIKQHLGIEVPSWKCDRTSCIPIIGVANYELMGEFVYGEEATAKTKPVSGAIQAMGTLSDLASLFVVTNRRTSNITFAQKWLKAQSIATLVQAVMSSAQRSKARICADLGISLLLDDDIRHLVAAENTELEVVLFKPGSDEDCLPGGVKRVRTWQEFVALLTDSLARPCTAKEPSSRFPHLDGCASKQVAVRDGGAKTAMREQQNTRPFPVVDIRRPASHSWTSRFPSLERILT